MADSRFFGGKLSTQDAFSMGAHQVQEFFRDMRRYPRRHGIPVQYEQSADVALSNINDLFTMDPREPVYLPFQLFPSSQSNIPLKKFPMSTIFDFMGWIFSVANSPNPSANSLNFYRPLAAIYAKFCQSHQRKTIDRPSVITLTSFTLNAQSYVIVGAALGQPESIRHSASVNLKTRLQRFRHEALVEAGLIADDEHSLSGVAYGYCAESWFLCLAKAFGLQGPVQGLAMDLESSLFTATLYSLDSEIEKLLRPPCCNCCHILTKIGIRLDDFPNLRPPAEQTLSCSCGRGHYHAVP